MNVPFKLSVYPETDVELDDFGDDFIGKNWDKLSDEQKAEVSDFIEEYVRTNGLITIEPK